MKIRTLFFLLTTPLYCLAETVNITNHDYTMVDLRNGLTTKLLAAGPTSITISVEWPLDMRPYGDVAQFGIMAKLDIGKRGWHYVQLLSADQTKGKVIHEILYEDTIWHELGKSANFEKKVWFAVRVPAPTDAPIRVGFRGMYEENDEIDEEEFERDQREAIEEFYGENKNDEVAVLPPSRPWLYPAILIAVCAFFYFVWRKRRKTP
jgi:hypothetical protein